MNPLITWLKQTDEEEEDDEDEGSDDDMADIERPLNLGKESAKTRY